MAIGPVFCQCVLLCKWQSGQFYCTIGNRASFLPVCFIVQLAMWQMKWQSAMWLLANCNTSKESNCKLPLGLHNAVVVKWYDVVFLFETPSHCWHKTKETKRSKGAHSDSQCRIVLCYEEDWVKKGNPLFVFGSFVVVVVCFFVCRLRCVVLGLSLLKLNGSDLNVVIVGLFLLCEFDGFLLEWRLGLRIIFLGF